jgi:tetratricopeptide (TPR) repeat protein
MRNLSGPKAAAKLAGTAAVVLLALVPVAGCASRGPGPTEVPPAAAAEPTPAERAVQMYDEGRYEEARVAIEALEQGGPLSGPLLYRLGFCYGQARDTNRQNDLMRRALGELEKEAASADSLEVSFFLANALNNVGRIPDAKNAAARATARIENGEWPKPVAPIDLFRAGKLYQDQGRRDEAMQKYRAALAGWDSKGAKVPGYRRWALRYLSQEAFSAADHRQAETDLAALVALGGASPQEHDRLAVARVKLKDWPGAAAAWREAERLDPANADRPRYCRNLAVLAQSAGQVPVAAPSGAAWSSLSQAELDALMAEQAKTLREARAEVVAGVSAERKAELAERVVRARGAFVGAGLEYAMRYLDIRQASFTGGYAPLIFHPEEWTVEPPPAEPAE